MQTDSRDSKRQKERARGQTRKSLLKYSARMWRKLAGKSAWHKIAANVGQRQKGKKDTLGSQRHTHTHTYICMHARACICLNFNMLSFSICNICCSSWPCNILLQIFLLELSQRGEGEKRTQSEMEKKLK